MSWLNAEPDYEGPLLTAYLLDAHTRAARWPTYKQRRKRYINDAIKIIELASTKELDESLQKKINIIASDLDHFLRLLSQN